MHVSQYAGVLHVMLAPVSPHISLDPGVGLMRPCDRHSFPRQKMIFLRQGGSNTTHGRAFIFVNRCAQRLSGWLGTLEPSNGSLEPHVLPASVVLATLVRQPALSTHILLLLALRSLKDLKSLNVDARSGTMFTLLPLADISKRMVISLPPPF